MRKTLCVSVLMLALCGSVYAGDINSPPATAPCDISTPTCAPQPSDEPKTSDEPTTDGWVGTGTSDPTADGVAEAVMTIISSVLALL